MLLREDFLKAIDSSVARFPVVNALVKVADPRVLQHLDAIATMLALYAAQLEVSTAEPFEKTRDSTVLADAAMRGIVRKSVPAKVQITIENKGSASFRVDGGRALMDVAGRRLRAEVAVDVPAGESATLIASQLYSKTSQHRVTESAPFYAIEIDDADDDSTLCGVVISDADGGYEYRERYVNSFADERIYHIETDERQRLYIRFGQEAVVGTQPLEDSQIDITAYYSMGDAAFKSGSPVVFDTMEDPQEALVELRIDAVLTPGKDPLAMDVLRELAKYPSVYNHNAVFLGEFDFLVRSNFPELQFLSVWNESIEERARGMNLESINTLFVACLAGDGAEAVLAQSSSESIAPQMITDLTGTQQAIKAKILAADDSYRVRFYTPVRSEVGLVVHAKVATSYAEGMVRDQIRAVLLENFGESAPQSRGGQSVPLYQQIYQILQDGVPALGVGRADLRVTIDEVLDGVERPELWRFVSPDSLQVSVSSGGVSTPYWGAGF